MEMPIGQRIKAWRRRSGRNQTDCAAAMGLQVSGLSRIENGYTDAETGQRRHQQVTAEQLERLAAFLGLTMAEFYGAIPEASPANPAAANG